MNTLIRTAHRTSMFRAAGQVTEKGDALLARLGTTPKAWSMLTPNGRLKSLADIGIVSAADVATALASLGTPAFTLGVSVVPQRTPVTYHAQTTTPPNNTAKYVALGAAALLAVWWLRRK